MRIYRESAANAPRADPTLHELPFNALDVVLPSALIHEPLDLEYEVSLTFPLSTLLSKALLFRLRERSWSRSFVISNPRLQFGSR